MRVIEGLGRTVLMSRASAGVARFRQLDALAKPWSPRPNPGPAALRAAAQIRPMILCGQGPQGLPCQVPEVVSGGLGSLGASAWWSSPISEWRCSELPTVVEDLGRALAESKRIGATSMAVKDAQAFYDRESSWWNGTNPWTESKCKELSNFGRALLNALNTTNQASGGQTVAVSPVYTGDSGTGPSFFGGLFSDTTSTIKTVAIAAAVVAGVVVVAPIVWEAVAAVRSSRSR